MAKLLFLLLIAGILSCGGLPVSAPVQASATASKRCLILATNDSESNFDGLKGADGTYGLPIARIAGVYQRELQRNPGGVLLVEGGDILQGRYMERLDGNAVAARRAAFDIYAGAGYTWMTLGNHEFDANTKTLSAALAGRHPGLLDLNVDPSALSTQNNWQIVECGGIRLALAGVLTPSTRTISDPGELEIRSPIKALHDHPPPPADARVLLSHLGIDDDEQLAKESNYLDVIIGGHSHTLLPAARQVGQVRIGQSGSRFSHLAFWELSIVQGKLQINYHLEPVNEAMPVAAEVAQAVTALRATLVAEEVIGERKIAWDLEDLAHSDYPRRAARAVQQYAQAHTKAPVDAALLNFGGFRSSERYPPGPVTNVQVQAIHPFKNRLVFVQLHGDQLQAVLENSCTTGHSEAHGRNLVGWGLDFHCDLTKPSIVYRMADNQPIGIATPGQRATVKVQGKPLDLQATYRIATLDYLARGGSSYFALTLGQRTCADGTVFSGPGSCANSPLLWEIIAQSVVESRLDAPL